MNRICKAIFALLLSAAAPVATTGQKHYVGGDISLLTKYEEKGANYLDVNGQKIPDMLAFLREQGLNTMRVRLFVDPSKAPDKEVQQGVCQDLDFVTALGSRIKAAGLQFMLDFHYSDSWADPSNQWTPDAWKTLGNDELYTKIYDYTLDCLQQMNAAGASPDFIQIGNEISYGLLWGPRNTKTYYCTQQSPASTWTRFTTLLSQAGKACREACPNAKIIIHSERVQRPDVMVDYFNRMDKAGVEYDIIGLSYYPFHHGYFDALNTAITRLESSFPTRNVMLVETGYYHKWQPSDVSFDYSATYPISHEGQRKFAAALIDQLKGHKNVNGLVWWWLEANENGIDWQQAVTPSGWYNAGLFDNETGRALPALYELKSLTDGDQEETVKGDVNGDGAVDVADITAIIAVMAGYTEPQSNSAPNPQSGSALNPQSGSAPNPADVNGDGTVDVADITAVINIMANQ